MSDIGRRKRRFVPGGPAPMPGKALPNATPRHLFGRRTLNPAKTHSSALPRPRNEALAGRAAGGTRAGASGNEQRHNICRFQLE